MLMTTRDEGAIISALTVFCASNRNINLFQYCDYYCLDEDDDYSSLIHYVCSNDHAQVFTYLLDEGFTCLLTERTKVTRYLPIEIAFEKKSEKCLKKFGNLSTEARLMVVSTLGKSTVFGIQVIINILKFKHSELINFCDSDLSLWYVKDVFKEKQTLYRDEMLQAVINTDLDKIQEYIDNGFDLNSMDGNYILMEILSENKNSKNKEKLKTIAFLISNNVLYKYNDVKDFLSKEEIAWIREFICVFLTGNNNEKLMTKLLFLKTNAGDITTGENRILAIYSDLYGVSSKKSDANIIKYLRPIMDIIAVCPMSLIYGPMEKVAFPADGNDKGLAEPTENKVFFSIYKGEEGSIDLANTKGTAIHEFCHMVSYILYNNKAIPCRSDDDVTKEKYIKVLESLRPHKDTINEIIKFVFNAKSYPTIDSQLAELVVRVPLL